MICPSPCFRENLLLVRKRKPWRATTGKRLVKSPKLSIRDSGLVHELLGIGTLETRAGHPVVGASWEGFVIENLLACAPARTEAYFHRANAGAEVDLVLKFRNGETWAVEIKWGLSPVLKPGFFSAVEDIAPDKAFVVYGGEETDVSRRNRTGGLGRTSVFWHWTGRKRGSWNPRTASFIGWFQNPLDFWISSDPSQPNPNQP